MAKHFHLETLLRLADEARQFSNAHARNGERRTADLLWQISKALRDAASRIEAATADETRSGSAEGESLTGEAGDAQTTPSENPS